MAKAVMTTRHPHSALAARYDKAASNWRQKLARLSYPDAFRELIDWAGLFDLSGARVLDAGTGCGDFALALLDHHQPKSLDLLDISADMLAVAAKRLSPKITPKLCHQSLETIPENSYDLILCAHVIEHCPDPLTALRHMRRALKPNGRLLLAASKPHICTILLQFVWRHRAFRPEKMERMLSIAGFKTINIHPFSTGVPARLSCGYLATI